jgi:hypothetical protein
VGRREVDVRRSRIAPLGDARVESHA